MKRCAFLMALSCLVGSIGCCSSMEDHPDETAAMLRVGVDAQPTPQPEVYLSVDPPAEAGDSLLDWQLASADGEDSIETVPAGESQGDQTGRSYDHFTTRIGPAYPGDFWHSVGRDAKEWLPMMWDDTKAVLESPWGWAGLTAVAATGLTLNGHHDDQVADHYAREGGELNQFWDQVGDVGGNPGTHFAIAGAMYFGGLYYGDNETYGKGKMMLSALAINGLVTMATKVGARTESPNGDEMGWLSGHTSSSFCFAATLYEAYGPWVGLPAYAFAGFVGYERIDARNHDFSDVISGAILGATIGHLVAQNHAPRVAGMTVVPYTSDRGGLGIALFKEW
ncbi:MAG: phosphatase PAP2 family protein [Phycisphaerae bacterium]